MKPQKLKYAEVETVRVALMRGQRNKCPICRQAFGPKAKKPALDHNHRTGYVRGTLCIWCNGMLGKVENAAQRAVGKDNNLIPWLVEAAAYLEKHERPAYGLPGIRTGLIYPTHKTPEDKRLARLEKAKIKRRKAALAKKVR